MKILELAREQRATLIKPAEDAIAAAEAEGRELTEAEYAEVRSASKAAKPIDERIADLTDLNERNALAAKVLSTVGGARVKSEPNTYAQRGEHSHVRDVMLATVQNDPQAWDRLRRHRREVEVEQRDITRVDGAGGEFVQLIAA